MHAARWRVIADRWRHRLGRRHDGSSLEVTYQSKKTLGIYDPNYRPRTYRDYARFVGLEDLPAGQKLVVHENVLGGKRSGTVLFQYPAPGMLDGDFYETFGCKAKPRASTVEERIAADAHAPGRLPREAPQCQVVLGGAIHVKVVDLRDDGTGIVHIRTVDTLQRCDGDFDFEVRRIEPPPGHRASGSAELDIAYWDVVRLSPRAR